MLSIDWFYKFMTIWIFIPLLCNSICGTNVSFPKSQLTNKKTTFSHHGINYLITLRYNDLQLINQFSHIVFPSSLSNKCYQQKVLQTTIFLLCVYTRETEGKIKLAAVFTKERYFKWNSTRNASYTSITMGGTASAGAFAHAWSIHTQRRAHKKGPRVTPRKITWHQ